jgi:hypothetical protein
LGEEIPNAKTHLEESEEPRRAPPQHGESKKDKKEVDE